MGRFLRPVTPRGTPAPLSPSNLSPSISGHTSLSAQVQAWLSPLLEEQDTAGLVAVSFFALSSLSSALVWSIAWGLFPMEYYQWAALATRQVGKAFYIVALGFGYLSDRRLPRWLATYITAIAVVWYGWSAVGLPGSIYPWNVISHTVLGVVAAVPALLAHAWRRFRTRTA